MPCRGESQMSPDPRPASDIFENQSVRGSGDPVSQRRSSRLRASRARKPGWCTDLLASRDASAVLTYSREKWMCWLHVSMTLHDSAIDRSNAVGFLFSIFGFHSIQVGFSSCYFFFDFCQIKFGAVGCGRSFTLIKWKVKKTLRLRYRWEHGHNWFVKLSAAPRCISRASRLASTLEASS